MASLALSNVPLLRCEVNRIATLVNATLSADSQLPILTDTTSPSMDDVLLDAAHQASGIVRTFWEVELVAALGTYQDFNAAYQANTKFADNPTYDNLNKYGDQITLLLAAAATVRAASDSCNHAVTLGGLVPPDAALTTPPDQIPAPPQGKPYHRSNIAGPVILGTMAVGTAVLGVMAFK